MMERLSLEQVDTYFKFKLNLKKKQYFDIERKRAEVLSSNNKPLAPPGTLATPSNQGTTETCAGHSVGKAVTEILDTYGFDTNQEAIVQDCIKKVQSDNLARHVHDYNEKAISVEIWDKNDSSEQHKIDVKLLIQSERGINDPSWKGPKMTENELDQYHTRMVAVWRTGSGNAHNYHAVFVKKIEKHPTKHGVYIQKIPS